MKKLRLVLPRFVVIIACLFLFNLSYSQTSKDTVKTGRANDHMTVNPGTANDGMAVKPSTPDGGMPILSDTAFLSKNIADNEMEIRLAKMGQSKSRSATVKKVAAIMITDHTAMLDELLKLTSKKPGIAKDKGTEMAMPALPAGKEFDAAWAGEMLKMHEAKIAELESFLSLTKSTELKSVVIKALPKIKNHRTLLLSIPGAKEHSKTVQTA